jgi:hypothetical protein
MRNQIIGGVVIAVGIGLIVARARLARGHSASMQEMTGGKLGGEKMTSFNTFWNVVIGIIFIVFGALMVAGVFDSG